MLGSESDLLTLDVGRDELSWRTESGTASTHHQSLYDINTLEWDEYGAYEGIE